MNVHFEDTGTKRELMSVHKRSVNGYMIVFTPDGRSKSINDKCIENVQQVMETTQGFDILSMTEEPTDWTYTSIMESMSMTNGESLKKTLESVFSLFGKEIARKH